MRHRYLIDGYNIMHYLPRTRGLMRHDFEAARDLMSDMVAAFIGTTGDAAWLVFDGQGNNTERHEPGPGAPGLEIVYASKHKSADAVIEREVYRSQPRRAQIVVSGDMGIRDLCFSLGAMVMGPENFLRRLNEADQGVRQRLQDRKLRPTPESTIESRLSTDQLMRMKKLRDDLEG